MMFECIYSRKSSYAVGLKIDAVNKSGKCFWGRGVSILNTEEADFESGIW